MPDAFYLDWLRVASEEAYHFSLLREHLQSLGMHYGDLPAHNNLWAMCEKTSGDVVARMALVPRTLEARGLDATPQIQDKLRQVRTPAAQRAVEILDIILCATRSPRRDRQPLVPLALRARRAGPGCVLPTAG